MVAGVNFGTMEDDEEVPLTPSGKVYAHPVTEQIVHVVVGLRFPVDVEATRAEFRNIFLQQPRFTSILVEDDHGIQKWRRTKVQIENHVFVPNICLQKGVIDADQFINEYLSDLAVSSPLDFRKPLWEIHILQSQRCCVLRLHHALGDGVALMSLFLSCCRRKDNPELQVLDSGSDKDINVCEDLLFNKRSYFLQNMSWKRVLNWIIMLWFNFIFIIQYLLLLGVFKDNNGIRGGPGSEIWPRKSATASFNLDDMIAVKKAINGTVNDVLLGIIMAGFFKYMELQPFKGLVQRIKITGIVMMNMRKISGLQDFQILMKSKSDSRWGNVIGSLLFPIYLHKQLKDPLECVKISKKIMDLKKQSWEAFFSYNCRNVLDFLFGKQVSSMLTYNILCNTTFMCSNIGGIKEEISFAGNPVTFLRLSSTSSPHAIMLHLVSYMKQAELQILVAKNIIPDPEFLASCFQDALIEMKNMVSTIQTPEV